jgi:hypothetical protein
MMELELIIRSSPEILAAVGAPNIDLGLVGENHSPPGRYPKIMYRIKF